MAELSGPVDAIYDAVTEALIVEDKDWPETIAAALRAAAYYCQHDGLLLHSFADELEEFEE